MLSRRALIRTAAAVVGLGAAAPVAAQPARPKVKLVTTGGTIANRSGGRLSPAELLRLAPEHERYATVDAEAFSNLSSGQLTLDQWLSLSRRLTAVLRDEPDCAGVVVTSGTDTLEELAWFLHLTVRSDKPVVVVGAMRPPDAAGYDGAANLVDAIRVAAAAESRGRGALVVMHGGIHGARDVVKSDTQALDTFRTRNGEPLGAVGADGVVFTRRIERRGGAQSEFDVETVAALPRVDVLLTYQGAPGDLIRAAVDGGATGIVLATAAGGTSGTQMDGVRYALGRRVVVVSSTRTATGRVAAPGEGARVVAVPGTLTAEDLAPVKARILLMLALTRTSDPREIQRIFREY